MNAIMILIDLLICMGFLYLTTLSNNSGATFTLTMMAVTFFAMAFSTYYFAIKKENNR